MKRISLTFFWIVLLVGLDQAIKWYAATVWQFNPLEFSPVGALTYSENTGIAFSWDIPLWIVLCATVVVGGYLVSGLLFGTEMSAVRRWAFLLVLSGAIGNVIDRIVNGYVIDWIQLADFPIFNLADSFITIGVILFLLWETGIARRT